MLHLHHFWNFCSRWLLLGFVPASRVDTDGYPPQWLSEKSNSFAMRCHSDLEASKRIMAGNAMFMAVLYSLYHFTTHRMRARKALQERCSSAWGGTGGCRNLWPANRASDPDFLKGPIHPQQFNDLIILLELVIQKHYSRRQKTGWVFGLVLIGCNSSREHDCFTQSVLLHHMNQSFSLPSFSL